MVKNDVGRKIKFIRTKYFDYTQHYMASKLNISQNVYSRIESGQIKLEKDDERLKQIASIFNMEIDDILNLSEKIVLNNCSNSAGALYGDMHNHNDVEMIKQLYERLLKETQEKYEALLKKK